MSHVTITDVHTHTHTQQSVGFGACFGHEVIDMQREFRERHGNNKSDWELVFTAETKQNIDLYVQINHPEQAGFAIVDMFVF